MWSSKHCDWKKWLAQNSLISFIFYHGKGSVSRLIRNKQSHYSAHHRADLFECENLFELPKRFALYDVPKPELIFLIPSNLSAYLFVDIPKHLFFSSPQTSRNFSAIWRRNVAWYTRVFLRIRSLVTSYFYCRNSTQFSYFLHYISPFFAIFS